MKNFKMFLAVLLMFISVSIFSQDKEIYHRAKIYYQQIEDLDLLSTLGLEIDHGKHKKGVFVESDFSSKELSMVEEAGFEFDIIIQDVVRYYQERNTKNSSPTFNKNLTCLDSETPTYSTPENFELGTMGGFMTYAEILAELDQMTTLYPNLITAKAPIGDFETVEGRSLYWLRMSDNPNVDEDEPEMMYDAVHHAREPASVSSLIFYMWYLLENYETNAEVQAILNNTQLYFVPVVNPDGYVYNETIEPSGGGLWRKNRKDHEDGEFGVDNNRNYGHEWGTNGISFNTSSDIFCGDSAFSEAENQAMKWFCENHDFQIAFNNHSYGNLLLYAYGYEEDTYTVDNETFEIISDEMTSQNGFTNQTGSALYPASGVADDWMYEPIPTKERIFAFTPEIGTGDQGFWPISADIIPICNSTMHMNLTAAHLITKYAQVMDQEPIVISSLSEDINFDLKRMGFQESDFAVTILPVTANITFEADEVVFSGLELFQISAATMPFTLDPSISYGDIIQYQYVIDNGQYLQPSEIYTKTYGVETIAFEDDGTSTAEWGSSDWDTTTEDFVSSPSSITDSPNDEYDSNSNSYIVLTELISLTDVVSASLNFHAKWAIETDWDYVQVEVSIDGVEWIPQCGNYTSIGNSDQVLNEPIYHGFQNEWVEENISLSDYLGEDISIRFQLVSDGFVNEDGFYFDDITVTTISDAVGIEEINLNEAFVAQSTPNPTNGLTTIEYYIPNDMNSTSLIIRNSLGQEIERFDIKRSTDRIELDLSGYAPGSYLYYLVSGTHESTAKKLIVVD